MKRKIPKTNHQTPMLSGYAESIAGRPRRGGCDTCGGAFIVMQGAALGQVRLRIFHAPTCSEGIAEADRVVSPN